MSNLPRCALPGCSTSTPSCPWRRSPSPWATSPPSTLTPAPQRSNQRSVVYVVVVVYQCTVVVEPVLMLFTSVPSCVVVIYVPLFALCFYWKNDGLMKVRNTQTASCILSNCYLILALNYVPANVCSTRLGWIRIMEFRVCLLTKFL